MLASTQALQMRHLMSEGNFQNQTKLKMLFLRQNKSTLAQFMTW